MSELGPRLILIVGMHRSGTSCLTGELQSRGLWLGDVSTRNPHNLKGNREHSVAVSINDTALTAGGGSWDKPCEVATFNSMQEKRAEGFLEKLSDGARSAGAVSMGFKDPRSTYTVDAWLGCAAKMNLRCAVIASFRHPVLVARSLTMRNKWPLERGLDLWYQYNRRLLGIAQRHSVSFVNFDAEQGRYAELINTAARQCGLAQNANALQFFSDELRHTAGEFRAPSALSHTYDQLVAHTDVA